MACSLCFAQHVLHEWEKVISDKYFHFVLCTLCKYLDDLTMCGTARMVQELYYE